MTIFRKSRYIYLISKIFVLFALVLPLTGLFVAGAQDNANNTNVNAGNANANNTNRGNANNTNGNTNGNRNGNANNTNTNTNGNGSAGGNTGSNQGNNNNSNSAVNEREEKRRDTLAESYVFKGFTYLIFGVLLIPFIYIIYRSIKYSSATYRSPLGLPDGSVRAILAYILVAFIGFYILASVLSLSEFKPPEFLVGIVATVIGFYFGSRTGEDKNAGARTGGVVQGTVTDKTGAPAGGASVDLSQKDGKKITQKADANGKYKFDNVAAGDYELQASLEGHTPSDVAKVKATTGANQTHNLSLK
ncbi:MAG: carboxypeptidase-like regulatory domain-containing protein [Acidobacteriota bacterium]|nr:carboxypeptidase-like regulatory domain-containing protein [Acidobacteriota bacterium]